MRVRSALIVLGVSLALAFWIAVLGFNGIP